MDQSIIVFLLRVPTRDEWKSLFKDKHNTILYYSSDLTFQTDLSAFYRIIEFDTKEFYQKSYEHSFNRIINIGHNNLDDEKSFASLLKYDDGYSWWHHIRFMLLYKLRAFNYHTLLLTFIKSKNLDNNQIQVYHESSEFHKRLLHEKFKSLVAIIERKRLSRYINIAVFLGTSLLRLIIGLTQIWKFLLPWQKVLVTNALTTQKIISKETLKVAKGDHFSEYLQDEMSIQKGCILLSDNFPPKFQDSSRLKWNDIKILPRHQRTVNVEILVLLSLFNPKFYLNLFYRQRHINRIFKYFQELKVEDKETDFLISILPEYKLLLMLLVFRKSFFESLLDFKKIGCIGGANEHDPRVKPFLEVAQSCGILTYGIQHGVINTKHVHYIFSIKDYEYRPFPDVTFLWGDYWRRVLTESSSYKNENLKIVGQIRTDIIPLLKRTSHKLLHYKVRRPVFLYTSQPLYGGEERPIRKRLAEDYLKLSKNYPNATFWIKPHPREKDYESFFREISNQIGTTNYEFVTDDLYSILFAVDLIFIYTSTVGSESAYFKKPLVVMDYADNDVSQFIQNGIGISVKSYSDIDKTVSCFIKGNLKINDDRVNTFVRDRAFCIDSNVSNRIISHLSTLQKPSPNTDHIHLHK